MSASKQQIEPHFSVQKIYLKSTAYDAPQAASVFRNNWKPQTSLELDIQHEEVENDHYEVVLSVGVIAHNADELAFSLKVEQAALFRIGGFPEDQLRQALSVACPSVMFPYLRENVDHLLVKGGYPALTLAPINFDAMFHERQKSTSPL